MLKKPEIHAVILAGGKGERFWPYSREAKPKQFLPLTGEKPLLTETVKRLRGIVPPSQIWIFTNEKQFPLAHKLAPQVRPAQIVGEPVGKDTAPCVAVAASLIARKSPEAVMLVLPADHWIAPQQKLKEILLEAAHLAHERQLLVTLGIPPRSPHTGYGYIHAQEPVPVEGKNPFFHVTAFKEKPDLPTAKSYLKKGGYFWNSGIFVWRADTILEDLKAYQPAIWTWAQKVAKAWGGGTQKQALARAYAAFQKISIDYAVLEKAQNVVMAKAPFQWDDLGSWSSLARHLSKDPSQNHFSGKTVHLDTKKCTLISSHPLVATLGVKNLLVVATPEITLVADKTREQELKKLLAHLRTLSSHTQFL